MNHFRNFVLIVALLCLTTGCTRKPVAIPPENEIVLAEGDWIQVKHPTGDLKIEAGNGTTRKYYWDGIEIAISHIPRSERWNGSLGIYNPAATVLGFGDRFPKYKGITRAVVEEGQRHYFSENEAFSWLVRRQGSAINRYVWTSDGLVVNFSIMPEREQMNIDIWQIYVNGRKPENLEGAQDHLFSSSITYIRSQPVAGGDATR